MYHVDSEVFLVLFSYRRHPFHQYNCLFDRQARATMALRLRIGSSSRSLMCIPFRLKNVPEMGKLDFDIKKCLLPVYMFVKLYLCQEQPRQQMNQAFSIFKTFAPNLTSYFLLQQVPRPNEKKYRNNKSCHIITIPAQINVE